VLKKFESIIASRYIFSKRKFNFISIISWLSVTGLALGVASLIIVQSIFNGFRDFAQSQMHSVPPHVQIFSNGNNFDKINEIVKEFEHESYISEMQSTKAMIMTSEKQSLVNIRSLSDAKLFAELRNNFVNGDIFEGGELLDDFLIIGAGIASKLKIFPSDTVKILSPKMIEYSIATYGILPPKRAVVSAVFQSGSAKADNNLVYISPKNYARIFGENLKNNSRVSYGLTLAEPDEAGLIKQKLESISTRIQVITWQDENKKLIEIMNFETLASFIIVGLIVIIAVFNLFASMLMSILEKKENSITFARLGAQPSSVRQIFFRQSIAIGALGIFVGMTIGLGFVFIQTKFGLIHLYLGGVSVQKMPILADWPQIFIIFLFALAINLVISFIPIRKLMTNNL
jgi:lipoprotein-releasing system permease protein